jgi:uncharacterized cofD-like protein
LVQLGFETTAIVTMADDGGSTGVLRRQLGILPPGDVRNCLAALASDEEGMLARVFQYRFADGEGLAGHALGNLILAALTDLTGDFAEAVRTAERALHARGRVLPSTLDDVVLHGIDRSGTEIFGQACLATNPTAVDRVYLEPAHPAANPEALAAIRAADAVVIGPGSLYTSLVPNFLVAGVADALRESSARRVYVCNVANFRGETAGLDAADHVQALFEHGLAGAIDIALVHVGRGALPEVCDDGLSVEPVAAGREVRARIEGFGVSVVSADVSDPCDPIHHDGVRLTHALKEVFS